MQNDANEFVFIRKRKRLRTFDAGDTARIVSLEQTNDPQPLPRLIPQIAVLPEPPTSSPALVPDNPEPARLESSSQAENIITVEKFLRCSAQITPKNKQTVLGTASMGKSGAYNHRHPAEPRTTRGRKATTVLKRLREAPRIAKTLFRAAVLTNGDPLDTLVDDAGISRTRRPLNFVPYNKFATPAEPSQTDSIQSSVLDRRQDQVLHTRRQGHTLVLKQHLHASHTRKPLSLVPLQEAEAAYSVIFPSRHL